MLLENASAGDIVTFYSYKGGTGRSMALANVGVILARGVLPKEKPVLMIDWDLEAPGLYKYFLDDERLSSLWAKPRSGGLIELLTEVANLYNELAPGAKLPEAAAWTDESVRVFESVMKRCPTEQYRYPVGPTGLMLLPSGRMLPGRDTEYAAKIRGFRWEEFYHQYGSFFTLWREQLMDQYQFVLIDSRTGLTDTGGICTRVMPGVVVAVFAPNEQNLEGLTGVIRASLEYRWESRDPRQIIVYPVASRIDGQFGDLREVWWHGGEFAGRKIRGYQERFEQLFRELYQLESCDLGPYFDETQIPHDSAYAYGERIASLSSTSDSLSIGKKCANLAARLRERVLPWESMDAAKATVRVAQAEAESAKRRADQLQTRAKAWAGLSAGLGVVGAVVGLVIGSGVLNKSKPVKPLVDVSAQMEVPIYAAGSAAVPGPLEGQVKSDGKRQFVAAFGYNVETIDRGRTIARLDILVGDSVYRSISTDPQPSGWMRTDSLVIAPLPIGQYVFRVSDVPEQNRTTGRTFSGERYLRVYDAR
jgi:cellulose biosynthesis protein BcsQ